MVRTSLYVDASCYRGQYTEFYLYKHRGKEQIKGQVSGRILLGRRNKLDIYNGQWDDSGEGEGSNQKQQGRSELIWEWTDKTKGHWIEN